MIELLEIPPSFLIVDDDEDFQKILIYLIKNTFKECNIDSVKTKSALLNALPNLSQDAIIFLDENLPDGKGSEVLNLLEDFYVISMSSDKNPEVMLRHLSNGAVYFINKSEVKNSSFKLFLVGVLNLIQFRRRKYKQDILKSNLDAAKSIVAQIRHEINNPLGAAIGSLELIERKEFNEIERRKIFNILKDSFKRIKNYVDKLQQMIDAQELALTKD